MFTIACDSSAILSVNCVACQRSTALCIKCCSILKTPDGDLWLITEPSLLTRCAWLSHAIYRSALIVWYLIVFVVFCALPYSHVPFIVQWTRMPTQSQLKKERRKRRRKTMVAMKMAPNPFPHSVPVSSYPQPTRKCVFICISACAQSKSIYLNQCEFLGFEDVVITSWRYVISRCVFCQSSLWAALL